MKRWLIFWLFLGLSEVGLGVVLKVESLPSYTPLNDSIYAVGDFNAWNPADPNYRLQQVGNDYFVEIQSSSFNYKFTRGSWASVEGNANGGFQPDRTYTTTDGDTVSITIESWEDLHTGSGGGGTRSPNVSILDEDFFIPQLNRNRRIWLYLPDTYNSSTDYYRVIYMHDGQNLFDVATSFSGEWEVDETMDQLIANGDEGAIIVGIDNGGANRINELAPWFNAQYSGGGEGAEYINFIANTLKPHIDANYRTLSDRENTWLFGSSLGGLISMYGLLEKSDVFSRAGVFSPAYWFNPEIYNKAAAFSKTENMKVYHLAGLLEAGNVDQKAMEMETELTQAGFTAEELELKVVANGEHSEWFWRQEFEEAYLWLKTELPTSVQSQPSESELIIYPNPVTDSFVVQGSKEQNLAFELVDALGRVQHSGFMNLLEPIRVSTLPAGVYWLKVSNEVKPIPFLKK